VYSVSRVCNVCCVLILLLRLYCTTSQGYPVLYYQLNKIDFTLLKQRGVTKDDLSRHILFLKEYIFAHLEPSDDEGQMISVVDVRGMGVSDMGSEAMELWKIHSKISQSHYVERSHQIYVINASRAFRMMWKLLKPLVSDQTRRKMKIFKEGADLSKLRRCVGVQHLPHEYGGTGGNLGSSEEERLLDKFVSRLNASVSTGVGVSGIPLESSESTAAVGTISKGE
jgi:hypothetical protein